MPRGFKSVPGGTFWTMFRTKTPFASYSLMMPPPEPGTPGRRTLLTYQWSVPGTRTIAAGVGDAATGKSVLVGAVVTRWSAPGQSASLVGKGGEYFHMWPIPVSAT